MSTTNRPRDDSSPQSDSAITACYTTGEDSPTIERIGDYQILREIGRGGMGCVYEAIEQGLNRKVAIKVLLHSLDRSASAKQRFLNEALAAASLTHEHIVPVYHVGKDAGRDYFTMKLIDGVDLGKILNKIRSSIQSESEESLDISADEVMVDEGLTNTLPAGQSSTNANVLSDVVFSDSMRRNGYRSALSIAHYVAEIGHQIAVAIEHAHQHGIIHRDIKPSNILLDHHGKAWITDFGLAHLQHATPLTQTGDVIGTWRYMSPEQASGREHSWIIEPTFILLVWRSTKWPRSIRPAEAERGQRYCAS